MDLENLKESSEEKEVLSESEEKEVLIEREEKEVLSESEEKEVLSESEENKVISENEEQEVPVLGLADVMNKILKTTKPRKKKTIVLAKAKKLSAKQVIDPVKEKDSSNNQVKPCDWIIKGRMKPNVLEKNYEKRLLKITTSGVVNLFNAVNQCKIKNGTSDSQVKKDNFKLIDKSKFLGILLNGAATSNKENSEHNDNENEMDVDKKQNVTWDVLKKDFGNDTKWKNWDKTITNKK